MGGGLIRVISPEEWSHGSNGDFIRQFYTELFTWPFGVYGCMGRWGERSSEMSVMLFYNEFE